MRRLRLAVPVAFATGLVVAACGSSSSTSTSSSSAGAGAGGSSSSSASSSFSCAPGSATASGSTALQPLAQKASQLFASACTGSTVTVSGGGSSKGLSDVAAGAVDIGNSDVPAHNATGIDSGSLTDHQVAIVIFAVVVNPKTQITALTTQQIQDIFSGKVTNWSQVGGGAMPVTLIERKPGSGTRLSFDKDLMNGTPESSSPSSTQDSTQLVVQGVAAADGGVSYIGAASVTAGVKAVSIDGAAPSVADLSSGKYKFFAHEHMYTKGAGSPSAQSYIDFILDPQFQSTEVTTVGFVPLSTTSLQAAVDQ